MEESWTSCGTPPDKTTFKEVSSKFNELGGDKLFTDILSSDEFIMTMSTEPKTFSLDNVELYISLDIEKKDNTIDYTYTIINLIPILLGMPSKDPTEFTYTIVKANPINKDYDKLV